MHRRLFVAAAIACACVLAALRGLALDEPTGQWELHQTKDGTLLLALQTSSPGHSWGWEHPVALSDLSGLSAATVGSQGDVHFALRRAAGTFECDGHVERGIGAGTFAFAADPSFVQTLAARGIAQPTPDEQLELAAQNVDAGYLDQLRAAGLRPDLSGLLRLIHAGVTPAYVAGLEHAGLANLSIDDVVELQNHGVQPDLLLAAKDAGLSLSTQDAIRFADHGITAAYIANVRALGYAPSAEQYVRMADHGITVAWIRQVQAAGLKPNVDELIRMRDAGV